MRVKVLKKFRDKHTGRIYRANDVIEVTEERFAEINKADKTLIVEFAEETAEETAEGTTEGTTEGKPKGKRATKKQ